jgi:hypothetical protein
MAERNLPHLVIRQQPQAEPFSPTGSGRETQKPHFVGDRHSHGNRLRLEFETAVSVRECDARPSGSYVVFTSAPAAQLALKSLESVAKGAQPEVVAVRASNSELGEIQEATVFIPHGKRQVFLDKVSKYSESVAAGAQTPANRSLIEGIDTIRRATIRDLWTDPADLFPQNYAEAVWWEVWLRGQQSDVLQNVQQTAHHHGLQLSDHYLGFGSRSVVLLKASTHQMATVFESVDDFAELRHPRTVATFLAQMDAVSQQEWVDDVLERMSVAAGDSPTVCVIDTGVLHTHPLLRDHLDPQDVHFADPSFRTVRPVVPHATEMAGIALFGSLQAALVGQRPVPLSHRLESVKFLPDSGQNKPDVYGAITAKAVYMPENADAQRRRVFLIATTTSTAPGVPTGVPGKPTAWSAAIDALAFGRSIDDTQPGLTYLDRDKGANPRLFIVSAGNIRDLHAADDFMDRCDVEPIEEPAQAWNALTVGAYAEHDDMAEAGIFRGWHPIACRGQIAPMSRTSVAVGSSDGPFKPEVVAPGGNRALSPDGKTVDSPPNLQILTTRLMHPGQGALTTTGDTSAAAAYVANVAARVQAAYTDFRPETIRAFVVHSAEWTPWMRGQIEAGKSMTERIRHLRQFGMGVPDATRAIKSGKNALTLVVESSIHPYERRQNESEGTMCEVNYHRLPWPVEALEALVDTEVRLRFTLSYFVEPNPSRRGWKSRYSYESHGLRFAMKRPDDTFDEFRRRLNKKTREVEGKALGGGTEAGWTFGVDQQRQPGSLHTDIWSGTAADLAAKGDVAIYPVGGWWKHRKEFDRSERGVNYSLVVSIETPEVEVDLYTPVAQKMKTAVRV